MEPSSAEAFRQKALADWSIPPTVSELEVLLLTSAPSGVMKVEASSPVRAVVSDVVSTAPWPCKNALEKPSLSAASACSRLDLTMVEISAPRVWNSSKSEKLTETAIWP